MCRIDYDNEVRLEDSLGNQTTGNEAQNTELEALEGMKKELYLLKKDLEKKEQELKKVKEGLDRADFDLEKEKKALEMEKKKFVRNCEVEKERLARENTLLEIKLKKLEAELFSLANEKEKLARDRERLQIERGQMNSSVSICYDDAGKLFFYGAMDETEIKSRYRSLIKIYHPDNTNTTNNLAIRIINHEYERLRGIYKSLNSYR